MLASLGELIVMFFVGTLIVVTIGIVVQLKQQSNARKRNQNSDNSDSKQEKSQ